MSTIKAKCTTPYADRKTIDIKKRIATVGFHPLTMEELLLITYSFATPYFTIV